MPVTKIITSGTFQIKNSPGYIKQLSCSNAGTTWTLQLLDGPIGATNNTQTVFGGTSAATITTGLINIQPLYFPNGIQVVTAGASPGELDVDWY